MSDTLTLFVSWQDPKTRRWHVVGRLSYSSNLYTFVYTKGAVASERFIPFGRMVNLQAEYQSTELFPLFMNRLLQKSRPEYTDYLNWLSVGNSESDPAPLTLLARTGGAKVTDSLAVFPVPRPDSTNHCRVVFFCHGIQYVMDGAARRIQTLSVGEQLFPMHDFQNEWDNQAVALRTDDPAALIGYCPRYFAKDFRTLFRRRPSQARIIVTKVNYDAPIQFRLQCEFRSPWPKGFSACQGDEYESLLGTSTESTNARSLLPSGQRKSG